MYELQRNVRGTSPMVGCLLSPGVMFDLCTWNSMYAHYEGVTDYDCADCGNGKAHARFAMQVPLPEILVVSFKVSQNEIFNLVNAYEIA